jgi:hypothetical protein
VARIRTLFPFLLALGLALAGAGLSGCIAVPVIPYYAEGSRRNVGPEAPSGIRVGTSTKEDVFPTLGEPDFASQDGRRLGYAWTKVSAIWMSVGGAGGGVGGEISRARVLEFTFDGKNVVGSVRVLKEWGATEVAAP